MHAKNTVLLGLNTF